MFLEVIEIVAPVLLVAGVGFCWAKLGHPYDTAMVTRLTLNLAGPCLIFSTLARVELPASAFAGMSLAALLLYAVTALGAAAILAIAGLSQRAFLPALIFGNTGNIGLPICLYAYGEEGLALALIVFSVSAILMIAAASWIGSGQASPWRGLSEPIVPAALLGAAAAMSDFAVPTWAMNTLSLFGQMMIPMMLLTLGVSIARLNLARLDRAVLLAIGRLGLGAAAGLAAAEALGLEGAARGVVIIQSMTPTAVLNYLFAEKYGTQSEDVASVVVLSTAISVIAIPATLALLI